VIFPYPDIFQKFIFHTEKTPEKNMLPKQKIYGVL